MTTKTETLQPSAEDLLARAREDLKRRIAESKFASDAAFARGDAAEGERLWREHVGLLEVEMGRTSSASRLTMTPAVPATR